MTMADLTLYALAQATLASLEAHYTAEGVDLPERRYVADGLVAFDCEQVTVEVRRTFPSSGDVRQETAAPMQYETGRGAEIAVTILRCAPTVTDDSGEPAVPDIAEIEASALAKLADAEMVPQALREGHRDGLLPGCGGVAFMGWRSLGPDGGLAGGETLMRLAID